MRSTSSFPSNIFEKYWSVWSYLWALPFLYCLFVEYFLMLLPIFQNCYILPRCLPFFIFFSSARWCSQCGYSKWVRVPFHLLLDRMQRLCQLQSWRRGYATGFSWVVTIILYAGPVWKFKYYIFILLELLLVPTCYNVCLTWKLLAGKK